MLDVDRLPGMVSAERGVEMLTWVRRLLAEQAKLDVVDGYGRIRAIEEEGDVAKVVRRIWRAYREA